MALNPGDTLNDKHYCIIRQLGRGGFGFVYLAQDTLLGEQVAIKELIPALVGDETMLKRFLAEARATMRLRHERIVGTHNVFREGSNYYIVMECMAGDSLEARLRERGPLLVDEAVQVAAEVCEGLAYAHAQGVVHCDLKPANILFDKEGHAKVADFGIAHVSGEMLTRTWKTPQGFVAGTLPYMSPEQAEGVRDEPRVDIYALGAVLYRMLTGRTYLDFDQRETPAAQADNVYRIRNQEPQAPSAHTAGLPEWVDEVVLRALAKHPEKRYANAEAMRAMLLHQRSIPAPSVSPPLPPLATELTAARRKAGAMPAPAQQALSRLGASVASAVRAASAGPRSSPLPAWFWPAVGAAAVLVVFLIIVISALGRGGDRGAVADTRTSNSTEPAAMMTVARTGTSTTKPEIVTTEANDPTSAPTGTPQATDGLTDTPTGTQPPISMLTDTPRATATPTSTPRVTNTARPTSTVKPTTAPALQNTVPPTKQPTVSPKNTPTATETPSVWFWRGQGPFHIENGVLGFENYTDRETTIRIDGVVGEYRVSAEQGAALGIEVPPGPYKAHIWVDQEQFPGCYRGSNEDIQVLAGRALVMILNARCDFGLCFSPCTYEEPDR